MSAITEKFSEEERLILLELQHQAQSLAMVETEFSSDDDDDVEIMKTFTASKFAPGANNSGPVKSPRRAHRTPVSLPSNIVGFGSAFSSNLQSNSNNVQHHNVTGLGRFGGAWNGSQMDADTTQSFGFRAPVPLNNGPQNTVFGGHVGGFGCPDNGFSNGGFGRSTIGEPFGQRSVGFGHQDAAGPATGRVGSFGGFGQQNNRFGVMSGGNGFGNGANSGFGVSNQGRFSGSNTGAFSQQQNTNGFNKSNIHQFGSQVSNSGFRSTPVPAFGSPACANVNQSSGFNGNQNIGDDNVPFTIGGKKVVANAKSPVTPANQSNAPFRIGGKDVTPDTPTPSKRSLRKNTTKFKGMDQNELGRIWESTTGNQTQRLQRMYEFFLSHAHQQQKDFITGKNDQFLDELDEEDQRIVRQKKEKWQKKTGKTPVGKEAQNNQTLQPGCSFANRVTDTKPNNPGRVPQTPPGSQKSATGNQGNNRGQKQYPNKEAKSIGAFSQNPRNVFATGNRGQPNSLDGFQTSTSCGFDTGPTLIAPRNTEPSALTSSRWAKDAKAENRKPTPTPSIQKTYNQLHANLTALNRDYHANINAHKTAKIQQPAFHSTKCTEESCGMLYHIWNITVQIERAKSEMAELQSKFALQNPNMDSFNTHRMTIQIEDDSDDSL
ncbi:hypothetical protein TWF694_006299 [Orbilia ellipsospora]|uniref:Uncharacterized protein n=1 Tax=Orbilia ellipsospora TaxID=2528407 RepID=A0AAV9XKM8_9PEZI